jgi:hypothetical protein
MWGPASMMGYRMQQAAGQGQAAAAAAGVRIVSPTKGCCSESDGTHLCSYYRRLMHIDQRIITSSSF